VSFESKLPQRLDKWLRDETRWPRRDIAQAIDAGRVAVNGGVLPADELVFGDDVVTVDGVRVTPAGPHEAALFHKPAGMTVTVADPSGREDLSALMGALPPGCQPVGRLDRETTGALLLTTDGELANALLKPVNRCPKVYRLTIAERCEVDDPRLAVLVAGVETALGVLRVASVEAVRPGACTTDVEVVLREGKNRQLRRMCYAAGLRLTALHRTVIGPLELGGLPPGSWRKLTCHEVDRLWSAVGGRAQNRHRQVEALVRRALARRRRGHHSPRLERWLKGRG